MAHRRRRAQPARRCVVPSGLRLLLDDLGLSDRLARVEPSPDHQDDEARPRLSIDAYFALWDAIAAASDQATLGIQLGARYPEHVLEPVFLVCLGSRDIGEALDRLGRYKHILCPETLTLKRRGDRMEVHYDWPTASRQPPPILVDAELSFLLHLARRATRQPLRGARVALTRPVGDAAPFASAMDAQVRLGCPVGMLSLPAADLALPFATFNPTLLALLDPALRAQHHANPAIGTDVVAADVGMSSRTLQRQLRDAGTSFAELLRVTRRDRAVFYLQQSDMTFSEIAFLLGFDTPSSFFRAFIRWTGQTPRDFRNSHPADKNELGALGVP